MKLKFMFSGMLLACSSFMMNAKDEKPSFGQSEVVPSFSAPLHFIENVGQIKDQYGGDRNDIHVKLNDKELNLFIGAGKIHYQWYQTRSKDFVGLATQDHISRRQSATTDIDIYRLDMHLLGANTQAQLLKEGKIKYQEHYYAVPGMPEEGRTATGYSKLTYKNIYPQIDWVVYIQDEGLKYDFVVHPGGKVSDIKLQFKGASNMMTNPDGSMTVTTPFGSITEAAPYSFQEDGTAITANFTLTDDILSFITGTYKGTLTIDPAVSWGTYMGNANIWETGLDIEVHRNSVYVVGETWGANSIATVGSHQVSAGGARDGVLRRFNKAGELLWATYYAGSGDEAVYSVVCDSSGHIYISGETTSSTGIATTGAHQAVFGGGGLWDAFFAKFDSTGSRLWGSYYGGEKSESYASLAVKGDFFVIAGATSSTSGMATSGSYQPNLNVSGSTHTDVFLAKFDLNGVRQWGTYYGGESGDGAPASVTFDPQGNIYLFGSTTSTTGIATPGAHQTTYADGGFGDHFLVKFNTNGARLWGTYYGGPDSEFGHHSSRNIACDSEGNVYMTGATESTSGIATSGSHQSQYSDSMDAYLVKFNAGGVRQWATYFGGTGEEYFPGISVMNDNRIVLTGATSSRAGITTSGALQAVYAGTTMGYGDAFIAFLDSNGRVSYGSYYGGSGMEVAMASASDWNGYLYVCGMTGSVSGIATVGSYISSYPGELVSSSFLTKFCFDVPAVSLSIQGRDSICQFMEAEYKVAEIGEASAYIWTFPDGWTGSARDNTAKIIAGTQGGQIGVQVVRCNDTSELVTFDVYVLEADPAVITTDKFTLSTTKPYASYQWLLNDEPIAGATGSRHEAIQNGDYRVITVNSYGCIDTSEAYVIRNVSVPEHNIGIGRSIRIYPNPATDLLYIQSPVTYRASIQNMQGRELIYIDNEAPVNISSLVPGVYMIRITDESGQLLKIEKWVRM